MKILLVLAVAPALLLLAYVYHLDKLEKESKRLVVKLLFLGALTVISAILLELVGTWLLGALGMEENTTLYNLLYCFLVVACSEEAGKYFMMKKATWKNREFNCLFDGIVYAVSVSLGFALIENIFYVIDGGISVAVTRALLSIPGHTMFAVYMGYFYGYAKHCDNLEDRTGVKKNLRKSFLAAVLLHGFYDFCLYEGSWIMVIIFLIFVVASDIVTFIGLRKFARNDRMIVEETQEIMLDPASGQNEWNPGQL